MEADAIAAKDEILKIVGLHESSAAPVDNKDALPREGYGKRGF